MPSKSLPWNWVFTKGRQESLDGVEAAWLALLEQTGTEPEFSGFLGNHAGLFFGDPPRTHFVLREIRLGADHAVDFVLPSEDGSVGVAYELMELERPDTSAFTKQGDSSARLNHAVGQIIDWKGWLERNVSEMRDIFPAPAQVGPGYEISFSYTIVIGRRLDIAQHVSKRNALAKTTGIRIRSFDWLTDRLRSASGAPPGPVTPSGEANAVPYEVASQLKNPFYVAMSDAEWRDLRRRLTYHPHLVAKNARLFAEARRYDQEALARFEAFCIGYPEESERVLEQDRQQYAEAIATQQRVAPDRVRVRSPVRRRFR